MKKDDAFNFLKNKSLCVLSTVNAKGSPESAYVGFSVNKDLEVMIGTSKKSRKAQNVIKNPKVSLVFWEEGKQTLQYEGRARVLAGEELEKKKRVHFQRTPGAKKYEKNPDNIYIVVEPDWIRLTESGPAVLGEMRLH